MIKQKRGFWVFVFSLIPGAGELYMGFRKQGLSIMTIFWGIIALMGTFSFGIIGAALPIVWFYSFFNVHNLKSLTEQEFYSLEDNYVINIERIFGNKEVFFKKHRNKIAAVIIFLGLGSLWSNVPMLINGIIPGMLWPALDYLVYCIPKAMVAFGMIGFGIYLICVKQKQEESEEKQFQIESNSK